MSDNQKKFEMGQVIYLLPKNSNDLLPAIVQEEIIKRSIGGGFSTSYTALCGAKGKQKVFPIDKIDGEVFGSIEEAQQKFQEELNIMIEKYNEGVNKVCNEAIKKANAWYSDMNFVNNDSTKINPLDFLNDVGAPVQPQQNQATQQTENQFINQQPNLSPEIRAMKESDNLLLMNNKDVTIDIGNGRKAKLKGGIPGGNTNE